MNLDRLDAQSGQGTPSKDAVDALLFLARFHKNKGNFAEAEEYCARLLDIGGPIREQSKLLLREIRTRQGHAGRRQTRTSLGGNGPSGGSLDMSPEW